MTSIDRAGQRLFYEETKPTAPWVAETQTLLFHHGVATNSGVWADWLPILSPRYRLVRFDMRGFGRSKASSSPSTWSFDDLADDVLAVADAVGASKFHFVGESIGGTTGLYLALRNRDRLYSLTVSNGAHRGGAIRNVDPWRKMIAAGQESWSRQMMEWRFFPAALSEEKYHWYHQEQSTCSAEATLELADLLLRTDISGDVSSIGVPTLLISPDHSPFIPVSIMTDLYSRLGDAEFQVFARSRHGLPYSHGADCAAVLDAFLTRRFGTVGKKARG